MRNVRGLATRIDLVIAAAAVAASILVALTIHRTFRLVSDRSMPEDGRLHAARVRAWVNPGWLPSR